MIDLSAKSLGLIGALVIALQVINRLVVDKFVGRPDNHLLRELWHWHKPDDSGRQMWKNPGLEEKFDRLIDIQEDVARDINTLANK